MTNSNRSRSLQAHSTWSRQSQLQRIAHIGLFVLCRHDALAFFGHSQCSRSAHSPLNAFSSSITRFVPGSVNSRTKLHAQLIEDGKVWPSLSPQSLVLDNAASILADDKKASIPNLTVSLVKSVVGGGVLALPAAVAALGDASEAVLPVAVSLIAVMGAINAYFFSLVGQVCSWTGAKTFAEAWEKTVGAESSPLVAGIVSTKTMLGCLAYSMILADSFQSLAVTAGFLDVSRTEALLAVTVTALLPLCLMKDLSSLAPFSLAGIAGFLFTAGTMATRSQDGSYSPISPALEEGGRYLQDLPDHMKPCFGDTGPELQGLVLACTLTTAFVAHYNAPRFHAELEQKESFNTVTYTSFAISSVIMAAIAVTGFSTFGVASQPMILNNYSPYDSAITACRAAIAASLVFTFPLTFFGLRDGVLDTMQVPALQRTDLNLSALSVALLVGVTTIASSVHDLALLLSVGGGTIATAVSSVLPTLMYQAAVAKRSDSNKKPWDVKLALGLMCVCVVTGATGVTLALQNHFIHG